MATRIADIPAPEIVSEVLEPLDAAKQGSVGLAEVTRLALDSLLANKVRSLLTMLGIIIGVASVVALLALGNGASAAITGQIQSAGTNILTVMPGSPSNRGPGQLNPIQALRYE